ncbi:MULTISPECIES: glycosyltransferase family 4 protein [Cyanophyceae]|uniref:glycosyltransferase family 4 protein n=1 Tax=Cyanophyceae TaxID=3028117 RepID=UPI00168381CF|nr:MULTISPECIES: glycosyltransferase family 4 protein [Cyanophyceae]MBD1916331.1 glycosyltransferase family 4 protein [Phormidium sp. FACHB-77]MBD2032623.1 glycosyltransferase family 4 protein [Phormidium sp. FACHB-322]MBD2049995.1 glycosyltransferase family 4 protein [Leptolyngbya sp. FACHB-60]
MRILIYSYNYYPEPIGIAPLMTELAEGLVARGHQVRVVTAMPNYPERSIYPQYRGRLYATEERNGVMIQRCFVLANARRGLVGRLLLESSFITLSLWPALRGWRPDIILNASPSLPACLPVAALKLLFQCPSVLNLQDILPEAAVQTGLLTNSWAICLFEVLEKFAYQNATRITVIAQGFRDNLLAKGVPDAKMVSVSNWVDVDFIAPRSQASSEFRRRHGLQDKFVVLYTGNIAETQGIRTAIRAAQALRAYPDIQMVIVGESKQLEALERFCRELGLTNVSLLPFVPRAELPDMLAAADVGLILQKHGVVGFNMPSKTQVLLASGRPILASVPAHGTAAQAVLASGGGLVVEPENPTALAKGILMLYHQPETAELLARRGRQYALEHYSAKRAIDRYEALFYALVAPQRWPLEGDVVLALQSAQE